MSLNLLDRKAIYKSVIFLDFAGRKFGRHSWTLAWRPRFGTHDSSSRTRFRCIRTRGCSLNWPRCSHWCRSWSGYRRRNWSATGRLSWCCSCTGLCRYWGHLWWRHNLARSLSMNRSHNRGRWNLRRHLTLYRLRLSYLIVALNRTYWC